MPVVVIRGADGRVISTPSYNPGPAAVSGTTTAPRPALPPRTVPLGTQAVTSRAGFPVFRAGLRPEDNPLLNGSLGPGQGTNPLSVVNAVLSWASEPGSAVAYALRGDPVNVARSALNFTLPFTKFVDRLESPDAFVSEVPIIRRQLARLPGPIRLPLSIGVDIATDPLTYLTFGGSGAARAAARGSKAASAAVQARRVGQVALEQGRLPLFREVVAEGAADAAERLARSGAFQVRLRVPLPLRSIERTILETRKPLEAWRAIQPKLGQRVNKALDELGKRTRYARGAGIEARAVLNRSRYLENELKKEFSRKFADFGKQIDAFAKRDPDPKTYFDRLADHIEQPERFPPPLGADEIVPRYKELRDEVADYARQNGLDFGDRGPNYFPHIAADPREKARLLMNASDARKIAEEPFFAKNRLFPTLEEYRAKTGLVPETNPAKALDIYTHALLKASRTKSVEDWALRNAINGPLRAIPDVTRAQAAVDKATENLQQILDRGEGVAAKAELKAARQQVSEAFAQYRAALRTGDSARVASARDDVTEAVANAREVADARPVRPAREAVDSRQAARPDLAQVRNLERQARALNREADQLERAATRAAAGDGRDVGYWAAAVEEASAEANHFGKLAFEARISGGDVAAADAARDAVIRRLEMAHRKLRQAQKGLQKASGKKVVSEPDPEALARAGQLRARADELEMQAMRLRRGAVANRTPATGSITPTGREANEVFRETLNRMVARAQYNRTAAENVAGTATPGEVNRAGRILDENQAALDAARREPLRRARAREDAEFLRARQEWQAERSRVNAVRDEAYRKLRAAQKAKDEKGIAAAKRMLKEARKQESKAETRLRNAYRKQGARLPAAARAGVRLERANKKLERTMNRVEKAIARNETLASRPGRVVSREEWKALSENLDNVMAEYVRLNEDTLMARGDYEKAQRVFDNIREGMQDPNAALRFVKETQNMWKALALATPGFHLRNLQDDTLRAWMAAGARNPRSWMQAWKVLRGGQGTLKLAGRTYTYDEMRALLRAEGITGTGFSRSEVLSGQDAVTEATRGRVRRPSRPGSGVYARFMQRVGEVRDDWTRAGLFIEKLRQGEAIPDASWITHDTLLDYGELGTMARIAKDYFAPFATFQTKIIGQTARAFAREPRIPANINATINAISNEAGNPDLSLVPPGFEQAFALPDYLAAPLRAAGGVPQDQQILFNPARVFGYASLDVLNPTDWQRNVGGIMSPAIRLPIELSTGYSYWRGREFPKTGVRAPALARYVHDFVPGASRIPIWNTKTDEITGDRVLAWNPYVDTIAGAIPPIGQISSVTSRFSGDSTDSARIGFLRTLGGLSISPYDRALALARAQRYGN